MIKNWNLIKNILIVIFLLGIGYLCGPVGITISVLVSTITVLYNIYRK